jgi:hypothetical protein
MVAGSPFQKSIAIRAPKPLMPPLPFWLFMFTKSR